MLKITIPEPCHEDWNKMTPDETGRHCSACAKSVVDFTHMSDDEVKHFFLNKKDDTRVCGRFNQTQLHRIVIELPQHIFSKPMPLWKKFLAACLVVFSTTLFSCETKISGTTVGTIEMEQPVPGDEQGMVAISPTQQDTLPKPPVCKTTIGTPPEVLQGDIMIVEPGPVPTVGIMAIEPDSSFTKPPAVPVKDIMGAMVYKRPGPPEKDSAVSRFTKAH